MIKVKKVFDAKGNEVKQYILVKGDSFRFKANIKTSSEEEIVKKIVFKVASNDFVQVFSKDFIKVENDWFLIVNSNETKEFAIGDYVTEIEVTYIDDGNDTVERSKLKVINEIEEVDND